MNDEKKLVGIAIVFCVLLPIIGGNLFLYLLDKIPAGYNQSATISDYVLVNTSIIVGLLIVYLFNLRRKKRSANMPVVDERTLIVMKNYFLYVLYFFFIISGLILLVLFFLGVQSIEIGAIFAYLTVMIIVIGAGALVASKV